MTRKVTNMVLGMVDEGWVSAETVLKMCLKWMSEDDVKAMAEANELLVEGYDEED